MRPIFPRPGGKTWLRTELLARIPAHEVWLEPFCGALGAFLARPEPSQHEVINDADGALVNLFRQVQRHPEELCRVLDGMPHSRTGWRVAMSAADRPLALTEIEWAAETWRRLAWSFAGEGRSFGRTCRTPLGGQEGLAGRLERIRALAARLGRATIECLDWKECVRAFDGPGVFIFCDPPYTACDDVGYGVWGEAEVVDLAETLKAARGDWLVTLNDAPEVRRAFTGCRIEEVSRSAGGMSNTRSTLRKLAKGGVRAENRRELMIRRGALRPT